MQPMRQGPPGKKRPGEKLERWRWKCLKRAVDQAASEGKTLSQKEKDEISNKAKVEYISRRWKEFEGHPAPAAMARLPLDA